MKSAADSAGAGLGGNVLGERPARPLCKPSLAAPVALLLLLLLAAAPAATAQVGGDEEPSQRPIVGPSNTLANPRVTYYKNPESKKWLLDRIMRETGDEIPLSEDVLVYSVETFTRRGKPAVIVRFPQGDSCGDRVNVYGFDRRAAKYQQRLSLKCVQYLYLTKQRKFNRAMPVLIYVTGEMQGVVDYVAVFEFNGERYEETRCTHPKKADDKRPEELKCDGRGIIPPAGPATPDERPRDGGASARALPIRHAAD